jgi:hypothetical protein
VLTCGIIHATSAKPNKGCLVSIVEERSMFDFVIQG